MARRLIGATFLVVVLYAAPLSAPVWGQSVGENDDPEMLPAKKADRLVVKRQTPEYPAIAKMNYIQGLVRVHAVVGSGGEVSEVHVLRGHPFLAVAALKAIQRWLFKPAKSRTGPREFQTLVDVNFTLHTRKVVGTPQDPEKDLDRQVHPPELLEKVASSDDGESVRMKVLVSSEGHVLDSQPVQSFANHMKEARSIVASWNFRPARWGAIAVPWYLEVDVPVARWPLLEGSANHDGR